MLSKLPCATVALLVFALASCATPAPTPNVICPTAVACPSTTPCPTCPTAATCPTPNCPPQTTLSESTAIPWQPFEVGQTVFLATSGRFSVGPTCRSEVIPLAGTEYKYIGTNETMNSTGPRFLVRDNEGNELCSYDFWLDRFSVNDPRVYFEDKEHGVKGYLIAGMLPNNENGTTEQVSLVDRQVGRVTFATKRIESIAVNPGDTQTPFAFRIVDGTQYSGKLVDSAYLITSGGDKIQLSR